MSGSYRTNPDTDYTIGRYIRESRDRTSRQQLSRLTGLSVSDIQRYETDQAPIDPDSLWAIVRALHMRPAEAFRCARYPGARNLPAHLQARPRALTATQRQEIETYLDILTGRDHTEHPLPALSDEVA